MSAPKLARPVTLSTPSGRIGRVPTTFSSSLSEIDAMAGWLTCYIHWDITMMGQDRLSRTGPLVVPGARDDRARVSVAHVSVNVTTCYPDRARRPDDGARVAFTPFEISFASSCEGVQGAVTLIRILPRGFPE